MTTADLHQVLQDFYAASHGEQKLSSPEFNGVHNGDVFMNWLLKVELVFNYKHYKDP